ncbi:hypothetical protein [Stutzerimonas kirkiae]|uniref:hypothetical protein n=1 Tax=Stutzerimonas kirkiae TaxID=2211392 RepID=UPI0013F143FF|nr:hypothetical protein [Stutzerimonas kirkiae]
MTLISLHVAAKIKIVNSIKIEIFNLLILQDGIWTAEMAGSECLPLRAYRQHRGRS